MSKARALADGRRDEPLAVVLSLPCALDDACTPGSCTYAFEGEPLVPAILERVPPPVEMLVLNDGELAAESAREQAPPDAGERVLCLGGAFPSPADGPCPPRSSSGKLPTPVSSQPPPDL